MQFGLEWMNALCCALSNAIFFFSLALNLKNYVNYLIEVLWRMEITVLCILCILSWTCASFGLKEMNAMFSFHKILSSFQQDLIVFYFGRLGNPRNVLQLPHFSFTNRKWLSPFLASPILTQHEATCSPLPEKKKIIIIILTSCTELQVVL